ncbi:unnamed protein product, partial [Polarella glacialis]
DGKGKGKSKSWEPEGPPDHIEEVGEAMHNCEDELIIKCTNERIPHFNARLFLENKEEIGKVDEIFGPINSVYLSAKMGEGMKADSFKAGKKLYIDTMKLLPLARFLPMPGGKGKTKNSNNNNSNNNSNNSNSNNHNNSNSNKNNNSNTQQQQQQQQQQQKQQQKNRKNNKHPIKFALFF